MNGADRPKLRWLRVRSDQDLGKVRGWVKGLATRVNTYNGPKTDKNGDPIMLLGWDDKPDSDWGKFRGHSAAIWFGTMDLAQRGENEVRRAMGYELLDHPTRAAQVAALARETAEACAMPADEEGAAS